MKNLITARVILGVVLAAFFGILPAARGQYWTSVTAGTPVVEWRLGSVGISNNPLSTVNARVYPGGKLLVVSYPVINGNYSDGNWFRLNSDGSIDASYKHPIGAYVRLVYPDGRMLITRYSDSDNVAGFIQRILANGENDPSFSSVLLDSLSGLNTELLADGRIFIFGQFSRVGGGLQRMVAMIGADGVPDSGFQSPFSSGYSSALINSAKTTADGKHIIIGGGGLGFGTGDYVVRLNMNGSVDAGFNAGNTGFSGANVGRVYPDPQSDGVFVVRGANNSIVHLTAAGALDAGFAPALVGSNWIFGPQQADRKILYLALVSGGNTSRQLRRMNPDGSDDPTFPVISTPYASSYEIGMPILSDDGTIYLGPVTAERKAAHFEITHVLANGSIDPSFNPRFSNFGSVATYAVQSDGKYLIAGVFDYINNIPMTQPYNFVRLNANGTLDTSFQSSLASPASISRLGILPDGKILVGYYNGWIVRLGSDGSNDTSYTPINQNLSAVAFGPTGDVYGYAGNTNSRLLHFTPGGVLDPTFQAPDLGTLSFTTPLTDGAVLVVSSQSYNQFSLVRLLPGGTIDPAYVAPVVSRVVAMAALPDGNAMICEEKYGPTGSYYHLIRRLLPDGSSDYSYASHVTPGSGPRQDIRLAMAGALFDLLRDAAPGANAAVTADFLQSEEQMALSCRTDGQLIMQSNQSGEIPFRRYQRSTLTSPSLDAAPFIISPPDQSQSLIPLNCTFLNLSVSAGGLSPVYYQWLKDGVPIAGQTSSALNSSPFQVTDAGNYSVKVSNAYGSVTSTPITLTADTANSCAAIVTQPSNQTTGLGSTATFTVVASGSSVLYYQWMFNDTPIDGATGSTLTLHNVRLANAGNYSVHVYNFVSNASGSFFGSVTSAAAVLTTFIAPPTDAIITIKVE